MIACFLSASSISTISMVTARHRLGFDDSSAKLPAGKALRTTLPNYRGFDSDTQILLLPVFVVFCRYRCFCRFKLFETRGFTFAPSPACAKDRGRDRRWFPSAKRYGCYSSKADVGRALGVSERHGGVVVDWRYVDNAGRQPNRPGQNYDARSSIREPALQAPRAPLPPVAPRARGGRRPAVRYQDCLRARIHR